MEPRLLKGWCGAGELPNLARLIDRGVWGRLRSTHNQLTSSAWPTMATGANPGAHGTYNFVERVPGEYRLRLPSAADRRLAAFWETAGAEGCSVTVCRVPMSFPLGPLNGLGVADWLAPGPEAPGFTQPAELSHELVRRFGRSFWFEYWGDAVPARTGMYRHALRDLLAGTDHTYELFHYLLSLQKADLFFGVVREADVAGHVFWGFHEGTHTWRDHHAPDGLGEAILEVYRRIDAGLGRLLERTGYAGNLIIVSDHGMGAHSAGSACLPGLFEACGLTVLTADGACPRPHPLRSMKAALSRHIPWHIRRTLRPLDGAARATGFTAEYMAPVDFARSRVFSYMGPYTGEIWLNIAGRDPLGMVTPGAEQEALEAAIITMLRGARDPETGARPVLDVQRRDELFHGPHTDLLADLHVTFDQDIALTGLEATAPDGRRVSVPVPWTPDGGGHRPHGVFIACGPDIPAHDRPVEGDLRDVAPTAMALLDLEIPSYMEGRVLTEALHRGVTRRRQAGEGDVYPAVPAPVYSARELAAVEKRLADLGYI